MFRESVIASPCGGRGVEDEGCVALNDVAQVGREQLQGEGQGRGSVDIRARVADGHRLEMFKLLLLS